jgi:hypothetical protein
MPIKEEPFRGNHIVIPVSSGSVGDVFLCKDKITNEIHAVKV